MESLTPGPELENSIDQLRHRILFVFGVGVPLATASAHQRDSR